MTLTLEKFSFHSISVSDETPLERTISGEINDVKNYVEHVVKEVTTPPKGQTQIRGQFFVFESMEERIASNLKKIALDSAEWELKTIDNAIKLLSVEKKTQEDIAQLNKTIRKGCLLQIKCLIDNKTTLLLLKIDDNTFLDAEVMKLKTGLPLDTRMQKVAILSFDDESNVESILLSDTNSTISKYWRDDFFAAKPLRDSKTNTKNAFNAIDKLLQQTIKPKSKQDYYFIRNQVIIKFRQESFAFNDLITDLKAYQPLGEQLDQKNYGKFIENLEKLPANKDFDTLFDIEPKIIKAKLNNRLVIDDHFELHVKGEVINLKSKLGVGIDEDTQRKFVKIYSDEGYDTFEPDFSRNNASNQIK
ncbi:nucleoid-associated protein [Acinetobacter lactucae]|uniref:nucleoid-associated protein n=1 Tax=Acinetobacter lactucae TaxID=1785128 RepID=UPI0015F5D8D2|nr:nucleoid-associated protein [Acinetobacter lactucae]